MESGRLLRKSPAPIAIIAIVTLWLSSCVLPTQPDAPINQVQPAQTAPVALPEASQSHVLADATRTSSATTVAPVNTTRLATAVVSDMTTVVPHSPLTLTTTAPAADLPTPTPFELTEQGVREAMQRWIAAYNARDEQTFLAYLSINPKMGYGDCDYANKRFYVFNSYQTIRSWIRSRWAKDDRFQVRAIQVGRYGRKPGDPITVAGIDVHRTNRELPNGTDMGFKLILDRFPDNHALILGAAMEGNVRCPKGEF